MQVQYCYLQLSSLSPTKMSEYLKSTINVLHIYFNYMAQTFQILKYPRCCTRITSKGQEIGPNIVKHAIHQEEKQTVNHQIEFDANNLVEYRLKG